jgi:malonate-semialdehyde dehydrogenase (acetylating)/methylmalonate-semialdehyde dehydrogenase
MREANASTTTDEETKTDLSHYLSGTRVPGTSGRFADVFNPATGVAEKQVPLAKPREEAVGDHRPRPAQALLGGLEDQYRGAGEVLGLG